jgi:hypothetical protein
MIITVPNMLTFPYKYEKGRNTKGKRVAVLQFVLSRSISHIWIQCSECILRTAYILNIKIAHYTQMTNQNDSKDKNQIRE